MEKSDVADFSSTTDHRVSGPPPSAARRGAAFLRRPYWDPPDQTWVVRRWPDLTGYCFATLFFWLWLTPSLLPRPWITQGLIGGITGVAGYGAFRGVLFGLALRRWPPLGATAFSSLMFGCWHILSSLHLNTEKPALTSLLGPSELGAALADLGTVVVTGLGGALFCELRRRSGSLLVPMSFH